VFQFLIPAAASLIGGMFGGGKKKTAKPAGPAGQGAQLQDLLPQLMPILQQMQAASKQNYALQQRKYLMTDPGAAKHMPGAEVPDGALPLQEMVMRMTAGIMPNHTKRGL
jgi:hypothetical protein